MMAVLRNCFVRLGRGGEDLYLYLIVFLFLFVLVFVFVFDMRTMWESVMGVLRNCFGRKEEEKMVSATSANCAPMLI